MTLFSLLIIIKDVSKGTFELVRAGIFTLHLVFILLLLFHSFKMFFSSHYALTLLSHHVCVVEHKANKICFIYPFLLLHLHFSYKNERVACIDLFLLFNPRELGKREEEAVKYRVDLTLVKITLQFYCILSALNLQ